MNLGAILVIVLGLSLFELVSSVDNAIINAEVISTMKPKARRWFLTWGIFIAVVVVRGLLPWMIVWLSAPHLGLIGSLTAAFSGDPEVHHVLEQSAPMLLAGGGTFLLLLFLHWLFMEPKSFGLPHERFFHSQGAWFYSVATIIVAGLVGTLVGHNPAAAFAVTVGVAVFFITQGFKDSAEQAEEKLLTSNRSDLSKLVYLEVLDSTFSIDGVLGAFAFTLSVPLILFGNGLGALAVRQLTVGNIDRIKKYKFLKNGAMYSILGLSLVMFADAFGHEIPFWLSPLLTLVVIGYFWHKSRVSLKDVEAAFDPKAQ